MEFSMFLACLLCMWHHVNSAEFTKFNLTTTSETSCSSRGAPTQAYDEMMCAVSCQMDGGCLSFLFTSGLCYSCDSVSVGLQTPGMNVYGTKMVPLSGSEALPELASTPTMMMSWPTTEAASPTSTDNLFGTNTTMPLWSYPTTTWPAGNDPTTTWAPPTGDFIDCSDNALGSGYTGNLTIKPAGNPTSLSVYCDNGWTVIQRRTSGQLSFNKNWNDFKNGFGDLNGEFWLGNDGIHNITDQADYELLMELTTWSGDMFNISHPYFYVDSEEWDYELGLDDSTETANPSATLNGLDTTPFTTDDADNDNKAANCADRNGGGFWFTDCGDTGLNNAYVQTDGTCSSNDGTRCFGYGPKASRTFLQGSVLKIKRVSNGEGLGP